MFEQVQHQQQEPVVVAPTRGSADLLVATLAAHGIEAATALPSVYPSLDWAEGIVVTVPDRDAIAAREVLRDLGHDPLPGR